MRCCCINGLFRYFFSYSYFSFQKLITKRGERVKEARIVPSSIRYPELREIEERTEQKTGQWQIETTAMSLLSQCNLIEWLASFSIFSVFTIESLVFLFFPV